MGKKTEKWFVGAAKDNNIYILSPEIYARESTHKKEEFWQTLKHEYSHIYYTQLTRTHYPFWLNEGLAGYLSGKKFNYNQADKRKFLQIFSYFNRLDKEIYLVGQFWVEYLLKKFGRKKLLKLLNIFPSPMNQRQFTSKFSQIYNLKFNKSTFSKLIK